MPNLIRRENRDVSRPRGPEATQWDPYRMMDALLRWDPFRSGEGWFPRGGELAPSFDLKETGDSYVVKADVPGIKEDELEVNVSGNVLTISGRREEDHREESDRYYATERSYGSFSRSFALPEGVEVDRVRANLEAGVLSVTVPKKPEVQPKKITIGKGGQTEGKAKA
jgi:HSP20 family protein